MNVKLRKIRSKVKRSKWVPSHWQAPDRLDSRRYPNRNLSTSYLEAPAQAQCPFLTVLPVEIRLRIFEYVISSLPLREGDLPPPPEDPDSALSEISEFPINCLWRIPGRLTAKPPLPNGNYYAPHRLGLLLTCKQTYAEAIDLFYTLPTFLICDMPVLFDLTRSLLPQRLASIRHLQLHLLLRWPEIMMWWEKPNGTPDNQFLWQKVCETLAHTFTGLRTLRLYIRQFTWDPVRPNPATERRILMPLTALSGLREFHLWYRHVKVRDPFGYDYQEIYTFDIKGEECRDRTAVAVRAWLKRWAETSEEVHERDGMMAEMEAQRTPSRVYTDASWRAPSTS